MKERAPAYCGLHGADEETHVVPPSVVCNRTPLVAVALDPGAPDSTQPTRALTKLTANIIPGCKERGVQVFPPSDVPTTTDLVSHCATKYAVLALGATICSGAHSTVLTDCHFVPPSLVTNTSVTAVDDGTCECRCARAYPSLEVVMATETKE
jgi:hypothetical protein